MTTQTETIYRNALLADAAYVSFETVGFVLSGVIDDKAWDQDAADPDRIVTFNDRRFTRAQFAEVQDLYSVVHHQPDTTTGFSGTVFRDAKTGLFTVAFRGTNDAADYVQDATLALGLGNTLGSALQAGVVDRFLTDAGILDANGNARAEFLGKVTFTGHSLGGFLATWTARAHPELVARVDTFNGAGLSYGSPLSVLLDEALGGLLRPGTLDERLVHNYVASAGADIVSTENFAWRPGERVPVFIEDVVIETGDLLANHNMAQLSRSLAAYRLFAALDLQISLGQIGVLLEGASNRGVGSIMNATVALGDALGEAFAGIADPVQLFRALEPGLESGVWAGLRIAPMQGMDAATLALQDTDAGSAVRFALLNLHSFAVMGPGTASTVVPVDEHSAEFWEHRAYLLDALLIRNTHDSINALLPRPGQDWFEDAGAGIAFEASNDARSTPLELTPQHRFGSDEDERFDGGERSDAIFGLAGDDRIFGAGGADTLEGGAGNDLLLGGEGGDLLRGNAGDDTLIGGPGIDRLESGAGADTLSFENDGLYNFVADADSGGDRIVIEKLSLASLTYEEIAPGSGLYRNTGAQTLVTLCPTDGGLLIRCSVIATGTIELAQWRNGDFGIELPGVAAPAALQGPDGSEGLIVGDGAAVDTDPAQEGVQAGYDALGNLLTVPGSVEARADTLFGSDGADYLVAGDLQDRVSAGRGDDIVEGGPDSDILQGGEGNDLLLADVIAGFDAVLDPQTAPVDTHDWLAGGSGDDTLVGAAGAEALAGGGGADLIFGGAGDDHLLGDATYVATDFNWSWSDNPQTKQRSYTPVWGIADAADGAADTLYGGAGADWIAGGRGDDLALGEAGADSISGGAGNDTLSGGDGDDLLGGDGATNALEASLHGNDLLDGGAGADVLVGGGGSDTLDGGSGNDQLFGDAEDLALASHRADLLRGGSGDDTLVGAGGDDVLIGGDGADAVTGDAGADTIDGGAGDDRLWGDSASLVPGQDGDDLIDGGEGADQIVGGGGNDTLRGGTGADSLWGASGADLLLGGDGADQLAGGEDADSLDGGAEADLLWGDAGDDLLRGGAGKDSLAGGTGADLLLGGDDEDILWGEADADVLMGEAGRDTLLGGAGADTLDGGADDDLLHGDADNDVLNGGAGSDRLYGDAGNDTLDGGTDGVADTLDGGSGFDVYVLHPGGGNDVIVDVDGPGALQFAGMAPSTSIVMDAQPVGSTTVTLRYSGGSVTLSQAQFRAMSDFRTDAGAIAGGAMVRAAETAERYLLPATADTVHAGGGADTLFGGDGDDALFGDAGDDDLRGEGGADTLHGGDGNEYLFGGAGDDALFGEAGNDGLMGEAGADLLDGGSGADSIDGGMGNDTLIGGAGNDTLDGNSGSDLILIGQSEGADLIRLAWPVPGELDTVQFGAGIDPASLVLRSRGSNDLYLEMPNGQQVCVQGFFTYPQARPQIEFRFADAPDTVWSVADIDARFSTTASEGDDLIDGFARDERIDGLAGNDQLNGWGGNDTLDGGEGQDTLDGGDGNDLLTGGAGNDELRGMNGRDTLVGGAGDDTLRGGADADTYLYAPGDGHDTIVELDGVAAGTAAIDVIRFGAGITPGSVTLSATLADPTGYLPGGMVTLDSLQYTLKTATGSIRIQDPEGLSGYHSRIDELRFDDAPQTVITFSQLEAQLQTADDGDDFLLGTATNDALSGLGGADILVGGGGFDVLDGGDGNDTLLGGKDADILTGGAGDDFLRGGDDPQPGLYSGDRYHWGRSLGNDTIWARPDSAFWVNSAGAHVVSDLLQIDDVTWADLRAAREGDDLLLWADQDRIRVLAYFTDPWNQVLVADAAGAVHGQTDIEWKINDTLLRAQISTGDDTVTGTAAPDAVDALAGNDVVLGLAGNDTLNGSDGNDLLLGGEDADVLSGGAGQDTLDGGPGSDLLRGGAGSDVYRFGRGYGSDTIFDQDKSTGRVDVVAMNEGIRFDEVSVARSGNNLLLRIVPEGDQLSVDWHFVLKGKDTGYHIDAVQFADGTRWTRADIDGLIARSASGNYLLTGSAGADVLQGLGGNDTLQGGAGDDTLNGGAGDDQLQGGGGSDTLRGGAGADVYLFNRGDGRDVLVDEDAAATLDRLRFGAGIAPADVSAWRKGTADLVLDCGAADSVRVADFFVDGAEAGRGIEVIEFADGTQWTRAALQNAPELPANTAPVAVTDDLRTLVGQALSISSAALLANDSDIDGDVLSVTAVSAGGSGNVQLDAATGSVLFTPEPWFYGQSWFAYALHDGNATATGRVNVQVAIDASGNARLGTEAADTLSGTRGDDRLYGQGGADTLRGDRGNDLLCGGPGNDSLEGAAGNDVYVYQRGEGQDLIDNRSARSTDVDSLWLTGGIRRDELWFLREGNDLLLGTASPDEQIRIDEWFATDVARIDEIHVDGSVLYAAEVERLVQAMAVFAPESGSGLAAPSATSVSMEPLLAVSGRDRWIALR